MYRVFREICAFAVCTLIVVIVCVVVFVGLRQAVASNEVVACHKLQSDSKKYPRFFLAQWEADMCASHNIQIDAPVGNPTSYELQK